MTERISLKDRAVAGAVWCIGASVGGRAIGLCGTLALTRFVAPHEYGTVSIAAVVAMTASAITTLGFGQYVAANPRASDRTTFHATLYHLALGALALGAVLLLAPLLARVLETPELPRYLPALVLAAALERLAYIPGRVLARDMRFRTLSLRLLLGESCYMAASVGLAAAGWGAWALVAGIVARAGLVAALNIGAIERRQWLDAGRLSRGTTRELMRFGLPMAAANAFHWLSMRGDNLLMAGLFGPVVAGQYNLAYNLADIPASQIGEQIGDVLLPSFAQIDDAAARKRALSRACGLLALLVFPLAVGLGAIAPTLVRAIFDARWWPIAPMLVVLSVLSVLRPIGWLVSSYLQAMQRPRMVVLLEFAKLSGIGVFVLALGKLGPRWACGGIGLAFAANAAAAVWAVGRGDGIPARAMVEPMLAPLGCCAPLALVVTAVRLFGTAWSGPPWLTLLGELSAGAIAYVLSSLWLAPRQSRDLLSLLAGAWRRQLAAS